MIENCIVVGARSSRLLLLFCKPAQKVQGGVRFIRRREAGQKSLEVPGCMVILLAVVFKGEPPVTPVRARVVWKTRSTGREYLGISRRVVVDQRLIADRKQKIE